VYSHPPIARVGLTENQAKAIGIEVNIQKKDYSTNIMTRSELSGIWIYKNSILAKIICQGYYYRHVSS